MKPNCQGKPLYLYTVVEWSNIITSCGLPQPKGRMGWVKNPFHREIISSPQVLWDTFFHNEKNHTILRKGEDGYVMVTNTSTPSWEWKTYYKYSIEKLSCEV